MYGKKVGGVGGEKKKRACSRCRRQGGCSPKTDGICCNDEDADIGWPGGGFMIEEVKKLWG